MNKFNLQESEKNRILLMHRVIKEQFAGRIDPESLESPATPVTPATPATPTTPATSTSPDVPKSIKDQLEVFITNGCVKNGNVVKMTSTNPQKEFAIKQESTKTPGKFRYFFIDNTVGMNDETGKFQILPNKWACNTKAVEAAKTNIDRTTQEGGWKLRKDITDTDANVNNPQMYEKQVVDGKTLYRRISGKGITGALDKRQQEVVTKWVAQGAQLEKDVDAEQAKTWTRKLVSPKSDGLFSEDFYMYFPPDTVNNADITTAFQDAVKDQTPESKSDCKTAIEAYYTAFKTKKRIEPNTLNAMKEKVQACANQFDGKWGIGAFTKIDDYVDILRGVKSGGPSRRGEDAKWRLN